MSAKLVKPTPPAFLSMALVLAATARPDVAEAAPPDPGGSAVVQNPSIEPVADPVVIDFSSDARPEHRPRIDRDRPAAIRFSDLDAHQRDVEPSEPVPHAPWASRLPEGLAQVGGMVVPEAMLDGATMVPDAATALTQGTDPQAGGPDLNEICAFPDEVPPGIYDYDHRPGGETPRFHTVYLNFLGGVLNTGAENSAENLSNIAISGHMFPVYAGGEERAIAAAQAVAADFEDWAVRVVYLERPPKVLPYTMVMVGGHYSDTTAGPSGGVAPLDCEDFGQRNVCYAFQNNSPATTQANVISQEIGHTLGLGHTTASDSVMAFGYDNTQPGDLGFHDGCVDTIQVQGQSAACVGVNKCHCGVGDQQDDKATLFATFAPAGVDVVEPTIAIVQPPDGAMYEEGETVRIEFEPWDDVGGYGWKLLVENGAGEVLVDQVDYDRAMIFDLTGLPPDVYTITAYIQDHADHIVTASVTITVGSSEALDDSGGSDDAGSGSGGGTQGEDSGSSGDTSASAGQDTDLDDGCGCTTGAPPTAALALWLLGLLGMARRRR
ncbi:M10 family metallopeptidase domain-containing protein [Paraliomyxa miuraensis]|nr:M10 family metallopeptidase domain-containing protein [Paraliomyxa miuraensis]